MFFLKARIMKKILFLFFLFTTVLSGCATHNPEPLYTPQPAEREILPEDMARYRENIVLKQHGENFVSYEYRNVRIDELASLAINYCLDNTDGKKAYLREIVMRENHSKLATFDCIDLQ